MTQFASCILPERVVYVHVNQPVVFFNPILEDKMRRDDRIWDDCMSFPDLLVTAIGPDRLYRNNGDGTFSAGTVGVEDTGWGASCQPVAEFVGIRTSSWPGG